jgi:hypothetical protein
MLSTVGTSMGANLGASTFGYIQGRISLSKWTYWPWLSLSESSSKIFQVLKSSGRREENSFQRNVENFSSFSEQHVSWSSDVKNLVLLKILTIQNGSIKMFQSI